MAKPNGSSLFDLSGRVALVTGSTRGIGKAIAEEMARAGAAVVVSSRKPQACEAVRAEFADKGYRVVARPCNAAVREELAALVEFARAEFGGVDIAVANAAANPYFGPLAGVPDEAFDAVLHHNVKSVLWLAKLTIPTMAERGGGAFIVVGSIAGLLGNTRIGAYGVSKAAVHQLVRNLAAEWGPRKVRVNAIAPGLVRTDFSRALWQDEALRREREAATPLRRLGEPADIGGIAVFLASPAAAFVTGQVIVADGGVSIL